MNKIVNKFSLTENKFMTELHMKQPEFTVPVDHLQTFVKESKNLEKQVI